jgi:hypothetical protein
LVLKIKWIRFLAKDWAMRGPLFCPFRANDSLAIHPPRALPWAKLLRPFQGKGEKRNFKTHPSVGRPPARSGNNGTPKRKDHQHAPSCATVS